MSKARYVYDFADYTSVHGPIPMHPDGQPKVHTWLWGGDWCPCEGQAMYGPECRCVGAQHPEFAAQVGSPIPHLKFYGHPTATGKHAVQFGKSERIGAGTIIEADLTDGSYRSFQIQQHLERGACHEIVSPAPVEAPSPSP